MMNLNIVDKLFEFQVLNDGENEPRKSTFFGKYYF